MTWLVSSQCQWTLRIIARNSVLFVFTRIDLETKGKKRETKGGRINFIIMFLIEKKIYIYIFTHAKFPHEMFVTSGF